MPLSLLHRKYSEAPDATFRLCYGNVYIQAAFCFLARLPSRLAAEADTEVQVIARNIKKCCGQQFSSPWCLINFCWLFNETCDIYVIMSWFVTFSFRLQTRTQFFHFVPGVIKSFYTELPSLQCNFASSLLMTSNITTTVLSLMLIIWIRQGITGCNISQR
jgi:hypothetical protein